MSAENTTLCHTWGNRRLLFVNAPLEPFFVVQRMEEDRLGSPYWLDDTSISSSTFGNGHPLYPVLIEFVYDPPKKV